MLRFALLAVVTCVSGAIWNVDISPELDYPVSLYINPGDTVVWSTTNTGFHWLVGVLPDFSGIDTSAPFTGPTGFGPYSHNYTFTADNPNLPEGGWFWSDVGDVDAAVYGFIIVRNSTDVVIPFNVFAASPAASSSPPFAVDLTYPRNVVITPGTRVIWNSTMEPRLTHTVLITDEDFRAFVGKPFAHPLPLYKRSGYFAFRFFHKGKYNYICTIHPNMKGRISVCGSSSGSGSSCGDWYEGEYDD